MPFQIAAITVSVGNRDNGTKRGLFMRRTMGLAVAAVILGSTAAFAQVATTLEQAQMAGLSPERAAEVRARAVDGNTVYGVLETMLLNNIKAEYPANRIVALDFNRGAAVVEMPGGALKLVSFDTTTLVLTK